MAAHKYAVRPGTDAEHDTATSREYRWRHEHGHPRITQHAQDQWDARTPPGSVSPETAWENAVGVGDGVLDAFEDHGGQTPDEVRLYHGVTDAGEAYTILFLVCGRPGDAGDEYHVRTVYSPSGTDDPRLRAYLAVVTMQCAQMHGDEAAVDTPATPVFDRRDLPSQTRTAAAHILTDGGE